MSRTFCSIFIVIITILCITRVSIAVSRGVSVKVISVTKIDDESEKVLILVKGSLLTPDIRVEISPKEGVESCGETRASNTTFANLLLIQPEVVLAEVAVNKFESFLCVRVFNQDNVIFSDALHLKNSSLTKWDIRQENTGVRSLAVTGLRAEHSSREPLLTDTGAPLLLAESEVTIRLFGRGLTSDTAVCFTKDSRDAGGSCLTPATTMFKVQPETDRTAVVQAILPEGGPFYICARTITSNISFEEDITPFVHQGSEEWLCIYTYKRPLPLWASMCIILVCLCFSALFSGLNLGLMSLDRTELKILCNTGLESERKYARVIQPVRDHGNFLLCSILLGNVLVNSTFTILLDDLTSGLVAVIFSTLAIVVFGEITPQAICSRHGLAVGARTIFITKAVMVLTFPLSYPTSKLLDCLLGEEIGNVYNRERLKELVKVTNDINDLDKDEVNIISGALELRKKNVSEVMTRIEDVFMLDYESVLDFETVSEIMKSGYSRIPVYEGNRGNIVTMLYIKDLAFIDPDDNTPLKTLCQFYQNSCNFVFDDVTLDVMFKQFKEGNKGHMAFVHRVNNTGEGDPFYETIGLVTLEDVIEELIQAEIMDETDVYTDNRSKRRRHDHKSTKQDFTGFVERRENHRIHISPQLTLAMFQYLSTTIDAFKPEQVSENILRRLLKQDVINHIKIRNKEKHDEGMIILEQGKPMDHFVLILEGRVEVTVGKENLIFESGPFTYFGLQAITQTIGVADNPRGSMQSLSIDGILKTSFIPDYTVRAITDLIYISIKKPLYLAARKATLLERAQKDTNTDQEMDQEVEKLMHSLDEEDSVITNIKEQHTHYMPNSENFYGRSNISKLSPNSEKPKDYHEDTALLQNTVNSL